MARMLRPIIVVYVHVFDQIGRVYSLLFSFSYELWLLAAGKIMWKQI